LKVRKLFRHGKHELWHQKRMKSILGPIAAKAASRVKFSRADIVKSPAD
jgi:hypothetical protein